MKLNLDNNEIKRLYVEERKLIKEIAEIMHCGKTTIQSRLKEMGVETTKKRSGRSTDKLSDYKARIKQLYLEGKSSNEIGKILGKSGKTISHHLRQMEVEIRPTKKIKQEEFEQLWSEGKSDREIAEYFEVSELTIKTFRTKGENAGKFNIIKNFSQKEHSLSEEQEQMVLGSLLGDMNLSVPGVNRQVNSRLAIVQSEQQEELFMKKVEILGEFMRSYRLYTPNPDNRTGKVYKSWRGNSKAHKVFTDIYYLLYPNGIKTLTKEYLDKINNPIALAYWFMDDGTFDGHIATNCFSEKEHELIINWMQEKWNISCTRHKNSNQFNLYISQKSRLDFERLIFPYILPSMYYKLKFLDILKQSQQDKIPSELRENHQSL